MLGKLLGSGLTADVYEYGDGRVIKLFKEGMSIETAEKESSALETANRVGAKVPEFYGKTKENNRFGYVMDRVEGPTMLKLILANPFKIKKYINILAELSKDTTDREVIDGFSKYTEVIPVIIEKNKRISSDDIKTAIEIIGMLPEDNKLCHGDLHPDNIIMTSDEPIIIDWLTANSGHAHADILRTYITLKYAAGQGMKRKLLSIWLIVNTIAGFYMKKVCKITGYKKSDIMKFLIPVLAIRIKEGLPAIEIENLKKLFNKKITAYRRTGIL